MNMCHMRQGISKIFDTRESVKIRFMIGGHNFEGYTLFSSDENIVADRVKYDFYCYIS